MGLRGPGAKPLRPITNAGWDDLQGTRAERVIAFLQKLPVTSGKLAGTDFQVREWQKDRIITPVYATDENGRRVVRLVIITMPRKNGKTGLIAGLALCHLCGPEAIPRGQLYSASAERDQAGLIYEEMKAMISLVPELNARVIVRDFHKQLEDRVTGSKFRALSSDAKTKHGFNSSFIVFDELAQVRDQKLYEALISSTGAREEPLVIVISTQSPDPNHIMSILVDEAQRVEDGTVIDPKLHPVIYRAPEDADPWSPETWAECNPALGDFRSFEEMADYAAKAQRMPALEQSFRNLYLNQRVREEARFVPRPIWESCAGTFPRAALKQKVAYCALDLSATKNDLTALTIDVPSGDKLFSKTFFWKPEKYLEEAEARDRVPYRQWVKEGWIEAIPGPVIDYRWIAHRLGELSIEFKIKSVVSDSYNIEQLSAALDEIGVNLTLVPRSQDHAHFSPMIQALEDDILKGRLVHENNPVLNWNMDNVMVSVDSYGNRKFDKKASNGRIDGAVTLAGASFAATQVVEEKKYQAFFVGR